MSQQCNNPTPSYPEYAVRRETISSYFHPPLPSSTFHDLVNKGKILPVKGLRGFYRLNESLRRLNLREVPAPPAESTGRTLEDVIRLAFTSIDPTCFPPASWMLSETLEQRDKEHSRLIADIHRSSLDDLSTFEEKVAYAAGVLDAHALMSNEE